MVEDTDPHITGMTESWVNKDIRDAELGLTRYVMFRRDRKGRIGWEVMLYIKESIQTGEIELEREVDCTRNSLMQYSYRKFNIWIGLPKSKHKRRG